MGEVVSLGTSEALRYETARIYAKNALWLMDYTEAGAILTPGDPIPGLTAFGVERDVIVRPLVNMEIEGHRVGWLRYDVPADPKLGFSDLACEHDFTREAGSQNMIGHHKCMSFEVAKVARSVQVGREYGFDTRTNINPDFNFRETYPEEYVKDVIVDLLRRATMEHKWLGNWADSHLAPMTIFNILGFPSFQESLKRDRPWDYLHALVDEGRIEMHDGIPYLPEYMDQLRS